MSSARPAASARRTAAPLTATLLASVLLLLAGCSPDQKTPLPTKDTTIDRVNKSLDSSQREAEERRRAIEAQGK
jgi:hypothetical protein